MTNINKRTCQALLEWMNGNAKKAVILTHANPDGDALGSSLGLHSVLLQAGFQSTVVFPTDFPSIVPELENYTNWMIAENHEKEAHQLIDGADLLFLLDFNDPKRTGKLRKKLEQFSKTIVLIDHHPQPLIKTSYQFSDTKVSSTAELVYDFILKMGWGIYLKSHGATALLTGITADTASFSHNAARSELYLAVAGLISLGADQHKVQEALFNTNTEERLRLLGHTLSEKMIILPEYHAACISLTKEELKKYKFKPGDTEGFVNYPLSIKGIIFSSFFMENEEKIKISFRSKGGFAVNEFSSLHFGGGGHFNAAGGESRQSLSEAVEKWMALLPDYSDNLEKEYLKHG
ncbi:MAG: bifunctional oligoribonuclease/PAP phosphatase NrnA [Prolixibacteraceae bacterium]|jgi:phosphoesterase RecJ-like protein|nr:bifunctional oligoribonuclease/PAP phosphatase NrnA [Prolixibacteraceae bacterium]